MGFKNCHNLPSSCWLYVACNEVGWFQTLSDRYPFLRKFLGLKQFSKVRILFHDLWMNENQNKEYDSKMLVLENNTFKNFISRFVLIFLDPSTLLNI